MVSNFDWSDEAVFEYVKNSLEGFRETISKLARISDLEEMKQSIITRYGITLDLINNPSKADNLTKIDILSVLIIEKEIKRRLSENK